MIRRIHRDAANRDGVDWGDTYDMSPRVLAVSAMALRPFEQLGFTPQPKHWVERCPGIIPSGCDSAVRQSDALCADCGRLVTERTSQLARLLKEVPVHQ